MKKIFYLSIFLIGFICLTSFSIKPNPHLIVGNWEFVENKMKLIEIDNKKFYLKRLFFSSDEFTSGISILKHNKQDLSKNEIDFDLAFKIFERDEEFKYPVLVLKNVCDKKSVFVFLILQLDKKSLKIRFEKKYSSENINMTDEILEFNKTAGPPENWESDESAIEIEIEIPENLNKKND